MSRYVPPGKIKAIAKEKSVKKQLIKTPTTEDPRFSKLTNTELAVVVKETKQRLDKLSEEMEYKQIEPEFSKRETLNEYKVRSIYIEAERFPELKKSLRQLGVKTMNNVFSVHEEWVKNYECKQYSNDFDFDEYNNWYGSRENDSYEYSLEAGGL